jgi:hypothetical protein
MAEYYDRYQEFKNNGDVKPMPGIYIPFNNSDKKVVYKLGSSRLDKLSQEYYGNPYHGWLIMSANPQFGGLEFNIPDREIIRIPFPFGSAMERYSEAVKLHLNLYGK